MNDGFPEADWSRVLDAPASRAGDPSAASRVPLGAPDRWGGGVLLPYNHPGATTTIVESPQFIRTQASDTYSRIWSVIGTVRAVPPLWALPLADWDCQLIISQGVGQTAVSQAFNLRSLTTLGLTGYSIDDFSQPPFEIRSFAITGGLIGQQFGVRARMRFTGVVAQLGSARFDALVAPIAAGGGL